MITYNPQRRVLSRKTDCIAFLLFLLFAVFAILQVHQTGGDYLREQFPGQLFLMLFLVLYLVYLGRTLFRSLVHDAEIRVFEDRLEIFIEGREHQFAWTDIREVKMGEIHFKIVSDEEILTIPFIEREAQREMYRRHYRATALIPDSGRFLS